MCAIFGSLFKLVNKDILSNVSNKLAHRGPSDSGIWIDDDTKVALLHQRLSILDLSSSGHQPMQSACSRFVIVFNGEIYNHLSLRTVLETSNEAPAWHGHSDTETLLACF